MLYLSKPDTTNANGISYLLGNIIKSFGAIEPFPYFFRRIFKSCVSISSFGGISAEQTKLEPGDIKIFPHEMLRLKTVHIRQETTIVAMQTEYVKHILKKFPSLFYFSSPMAFSSF